MKPTRIAGLAVTGIVAAWGGYWLGHALGWSSNADWPWSIGGGGAAIALSAFTAALALLMAVGVMMIQPILRSRRLARTGQPANGLVLEIHDTGLVIHRHGTVVHQSEMELEVHPAGSDPYLAHTLDYLNDRELGHLLPGSAVALRFDPQHPKRVAIEHELILN